ncbi:hypothetical protein AB0P19_07300 [Microbacterium oleivorans]|uniref:hypothetical protein n=1 Tax=Microbacterium TaxID=33882 RepID=UPI002881AFEC|nr:hypothetical protein [Microbacterium sp. ARD31]MDT0182412.1 hypothetical protein [Microbacterium sp. ARD31]
MNSTPLAGPDGIDVILGHDEKRTEHERRHFLTRELIARRFGVTHRDIKLRRQPPGPFGYRSHLYAAVGGDEIPVSIKAASRGDVTVVALADLAVPIGLDVRPNQLDDADIAEIRRHSHLLPDTSERAMREHWTRALAVREADGRGLRVQLEHVILDPVSSTGWAPDRRVHYRLVDLSRDRWTVTLAYGGGPR